ncbi:MAG: hypothetical protein JNM78_06775 [Cyclobacteriaceae bacterium]|nr:hypothetical protein [Cyclobacteriaceae bacterium]
MDYKFGTQYFAVTDRSIMFLRNRFPYKEIKPVELEKIELTRGTDVKRPTTSIIFGGILIIATLYLLVNFSGFKPDDFGGGIKTAKAMGYMLVMVLFLLAFGAYSIYRALPIHSVIKFTLVTNEIESMPIRGVIKDKMIRHLIVSLKEVVGGEKIFVNRELDL